MEFKHELEDLRYYDTTDGNQIRTSKGAAVAVQKKRYDNGPDLAPDVRRCSAYCIV